MVLLIEQAKNGVRNCQNSFLNPVTANVPFVRRWPVLPISSVPVFAQSYYDAPCALTCPLDFSKHSTIFQPLTFNEVQQQYPVRFQRLLDERSQLVLVADQVLLLDQ